jgi:hypothetical protein
MVQETRSNHAKKIEQEIVLAKKNQKEEREIICEKDM